MEGDYGMKLTLTVMETAGGSIQRAKEDGKGTRGAEVITVTARGEFAAGAIAAVEMKLHFEDVDAAPMKGDTVTVEIV